MIHFKFSKPMRLLTFILMLPSIVLSISAQENPSKKKSKLEIGVGLNTFGPARQMDKLMVKYNFDDTTDSWLSAGSTTHPHYSPFGLTSQISYSSYFSSKSQLGILVNYSFLREIFGASAINGYLFVRFKNILVAPLFKYDLNSEWEFLVGPAIMVNSGDRTNLSNVNNENYTKRSIGVLSGLNVKIRDRHVIYSKIGIQYLLSIPNKMGPFTADSYGSPTAIPESKIGFGYLNVVYIFGIHL
jgi:hypothetical protein